MMIEGPFFIFGKKGLFCPVKEFLDELGRGKEPEKVRMVLV
jgi:hypothetical protein